MPREPSHFVFDGERILTSEEAARFDKLFRDHEGHTGNEVVLITSSELDGSASAKDLAVQFGNGQGVGKTGLDNGGVIAFSRAYQQVFIATGKGTERVLQDSICQRIVDREMLPYFKDARYFDGLWAGSKAVVDFLERPKNAVAPR